MLPARCRAIFGYFCRNHTGYQLLMRFIISTILIALLGTSALAQQVTSRSDLERRRQGIMDDIRETQEQLAATKKDKKATMGQLRALQAKLDARQRLIANINQEMANIDGNITSSSREVDRLRENLQTLRLRYAQSIRYAYQNRSSQNMLAFLFSASGFNDAMRRMRYLKKYRDYRMDQAEQIQQTQGKIQDQIGMLNNQKFRKNMLLTAEVQQKQVLLQETNETNQVVKELKGREAELVAEIDRKKKSARQLDKAINDLIRREIEIARKKAEEERKRQAEIARRKEEEERKAAAARIGPNEGNTYGSGNSKVTLSTGSGGRNTNPSTTAPGSRGNTQPSSTRPSSGNPPVAMVTPPKRTATPRTNVPLGLTPEAAALSNNFASNRGKLPWPVEKGNIVSSFGTHKHPIAEKVMVENNGIDIQTSPGATARAVFDGTVTAVIYMPGLGQNVLINHGEYFTVYAGLSGVSVRKGDQVRTKQAIGSVGNNEDGVPIINFQVWKGSAKLNPAGWIAN